MKTFQQYIELLTEQAPPAPGGAAPPPAPGGGIGVPGALPPAGGLGVPPPMGGGLGGGLGMGMGAPPMGVPGAGTAPQKLKAYNVWDVLEKVLGVNNSAAQQKNTQPQNTASPQQQNMIG